MLYCADEEYRKEEESSMKISPQILDAVRRAINYYGNTSQVAKTMGVAHSTVFFWLNGKTTSMSGKLWQNKIRPVLAPFLLPEPVSPVAYPAPVAENAVSLNEENSLRYQASGGVGQRAERLDGEEHGDAVENGSLYLVDFSDLPKMDPTVEPVLNFLKNYSCGSLSFPGSCRKTHFAVRLTDAVPGVFLPGTDLLVSLQEYPQNNDFILARIRETGKIVLGRYIRSGNRITLLPLLQDEPEFSWDCTESLGYTLWCYPVPEAKVNLRNI